MATTTGGSTYVTSTDLVANYPTASLALANRVDLVASGEIVYNTGNYTITVADILGGKTIIQDSASATTVTLPSSSLVNGMQAKISNVGAGTVTVSGGTLLGTATINQYGGITAVYKTSITSWWLLPFSGSVGAANFTNTATGTYTGYKYVTFTGNGSLVIDRAGFADILLTAGGGAGGYNYGGGGGGGGNVYLASVYLTAATHTVTVGGGGAANTSQTVTGGRGSDSTLYIYRAVGGGGGGALTAGNYDPMSGQGGGSGGGSSGYGRGWNAPPGLGISGQGNTGGNGATTSGGGGGGGNETGYAGVGNSGGYGGAGLSSSITNTAITRSGGGGGGGVSGNGGATGGGGVGGYSSVAAASGTTNYGGGGGGAGASTAGSGGSGIVIVRVAV